MVESEHEDTSDGQDDEDEKVAANLSCAHDVVSCGLDRLHEAARVLHGG